MGPGVGDAPDGNGQNKELQTIKELALVDSSHLILAALQTNVI